MLERKRCRRERVDRRGSIEDYQSRKRVGQQLRGHVAPPTLIVLSEILNNLQSSLASGDNIWNNVNAIQRQYCMQNAIHSSHQLGSWPDTVYLVACRKILRVAPCKYVSYAKEKRQK